MTTEQRETIIALRLQGQPVSRIAAGLGLSANTVKAFCQREKKKKEFCKYCRKPLIHIPGHKSKSFCNDVCRYAWWKIHRSQMKHNVVYRYTCVNCGTEFESGGKGRKYCGHPCHIAARFGVP